MKFISKKLLNKIIEDERKNIDCYMYWLGVNEFTIEEVRDLYFSDPNVKIYSNPFPKYIIFETTNNFLKMKHGVF